MGRFIGAAIGLVLLLPALSTSQTVLPAETSGFAAATNALIAAYTGVDVIALGEGGSGTQSSPETVRTIVLESRSRS